MPALANQKHELFAQQIAKGKPLYQSYEFAGYKPARSAACRLSTHVNVKARVAELTQDMLVEHGITVHSLIDDYLDDRQAARTAGQFAVAINATTQIAKLCGLFIERTEHKQTLDVRAIVLRLDAGEPLDEITGRSRPALVSVG